MSHPIVTIHGLCDAPTEPHRGITGAGVLCQDGYDDKTPASGAFGSRSWLGGQAVKPNDLLGTALARPDLFGDALDSYLKRASRHFANMTAICEELPVFANRVELSATQKDAFGVPLARVVDNVPAENTARLELAKAEGLRVFEAAGAEAWAGQRGAMHLLGGTAIGDDPDCSVTDSFGRAHEVENLFLAGASLFPTSAAVNPTATLAALVLRTADHIAGNRAGLLR